MSAPARLRTLRLVGFKSFAERTALEFGPGISAIVGPNGSGKSNLADALRWALGEQGRALRARRSEDVIFAGSARRQATGLADVTLTLDNDDGLLPLGYAAVELGRRLYRSGENEYLVNRQRVRFKDLTDLLEAANLADNAFLFIGQGMVDQALSLRPEERRPLFEEVAGVRRHERRRSQAEARLDEAGQNLARLRDILAELRPQARRLAAQAEQAAARDAAGQALATEVVRAGRARAVAAARRAADAEREYVAGRAAAEAIAAELRATEARLATLTGLFTERGADLREKREALDAARVRQTHALMEHQRLAMELAAVTAEAGRSDAERGRLSQRLEATRVALAATMPAPEEDLEASLATAVRALAEAEVEADRVSAAGRAGAEQLAAVRRAQAARETEASETRRVAAEAARRAAEAASAHDRATTAAVAAEAASSSAGRRGTAAREAEAAAESALVEAREEEIAADAAQGAAAGRLAAALARRDGATGRLADLEAALVRGEGAGIVVAARRRGGRLVAEGLEVEPALRMAVEAGLEAALRAAAIPAQAVTAMQGERGHLVVDGLGAPAERERRLAEPLLAAVEAAGGGPLEAAIRRDPGGTVRRLIARVVWLPDLGAALEVRGLLPPGWLAVALSGERLTAEGLVRLGPPDGLLGLRAEHDALAADVARLGAEAAAAERDAAEATAVAGRAREAAGRAREAAGRARHERRVAEEAERSAAARAEAARRESAWAAAQAERLAAVDRREAERREVSGAVPTVAGDGATAPAQAGQDATAVAERAWAERIEALRSRRSEIAQRLEAARAAARQAEDQRRRAEVAAEIDAARLDELERRAAELVVARSRLSQAGADAAAAEARAEEALKTASESVAARDRAEAAARLDLVSEEQRVAAARDHSRRADERARTAEAGRLEARLGLEGVRDWLLVELAALGPMGLVALAEGSTDPPGPSDAPDPSEESAAAELASMVAASLDRWSRQAAVPPAEGDPAEEVGLISPGRLATLRRRYAELGAGNPFAAQESAEAQARLAELQAQEADLVAAMAATRGLIAELSERIVEQFRTTFARLEEVFGRRFAALFGGGEASLVLTEPEDLSATGVEIMARPPGKKRQALAMLSGGERALTAVALLFAMLEVRPVPFCVLDEVDAALDEANVGRFGEALRSLASTTQFIVITHNRGTIEAADALYGVTIGDDAVSRVISLRLADGADVAPAMAMTTAGG